MQHTTKKHKFSKVSIILYFWVLVVLCPSVCALAEALPKTAKLIPPETLLLVDISDFNQCQRQFKKNNFYKFYKDPAMLAFVDATKMKLREKAKELDNAIIDTIVETDLLPKGRVAFALVLNNRAIEANEPTALLITQWGENITKIREAVDRTVQKSLENGLRQKTEDYRNVSIKTIIGKNSSRLGYGFCSTLSYCFIDDCLIGSEDIELVKFVIAHFERVPSPTLGDDTDYTASTAATGPYHDIDLYINIKQVIRTILAEDTGGQVQTMIANLGVDNIASLSCSTGIGRRPGSLCCGKAFLKINGAKKGICKMLETESAAFKVPRFIPTSAYSMTFLNLNIKKAYNELYNILYNISPPYASMMLTPLLPPSPEGEPGLQLKTDIIDHLGSQIVIAQSINKPFSGNLTPTESLFAVAVNNSKALEKSLSLLHSTLLAPNNPSAKRELLGHTIYLVNLSSLLPASQPGGVTPMQSPAGPTIQQMPTTAFTITATHLIFGYENAVERAIRALSSTESGSVDSAKWFTNAKSTIPSVLGLACLENNAASAEFLWWLMKETDKTKGTNTPMSPDVQMMLSQAWPDLFKAELLPPFDSVRKYFGISTLYGISRGDGFFFEFNYLNPATAEQSK